MAGAAPKTELHISNQSTDAVMPRLGTMRCDGVISSWLDLRVRFDCAR